MNFFNRTYQLISKCIKASVFVGITILFVILVGQVLSRYLMKVPFPWIEELARYLMIWIALLSSSLALDRKAHVSVTILVDRLKPRNRSRVTVFVHLVILAFLTVLFIFGMKISLFVRNQTSPTLPITYFWAYVAVPVGSVLMGLQVITSLLNELVSNSKKCNESGSSALPTAFKKEN